MSPRLPLELWITIFEFVGDWKLATAFGLRTNLRPPIEWVLHGSPLDRAILTGSIPYVAQVLHDTPTAKLGNLGAKVMIRWGYIGLLQHLWTHRRSEVHSVFSASPSFQLPVLASRYGKVKVLAWWLQNCFEELQGPEGLDAAVRQAFYEASFNGHMPVLMWWRESGLPLESFLEERGG
ncbi:hypothetical protein FN846DRAFT_623568 [Sphaerosporella brunnea]|uniref:Uncharacterized protein n=1 Tax=Sphaerosporella brunnea TaxID=1250544 RepID=A0A5J5F1A5_9PEZI|nr:hypothetical protein FN846DRAFT_623568 [Sphaerosporella brunnea]